MDKEGKYTERCEYCKRVFDPIEGFSGWRLTHGDKVVVFCSDSCLDAMVREREDERKEG